MTIFLRMYLKMKRAFLQPKYLKGNLKGIGLVEVIAALGVSVIVITALVSLSVFTLRSSLQSKLQLEGTKVASREIELLRAFRDAQATWTDFTSAVSSCSSTNPCHMDIQGNNISVVHGAQLLPNEIEHSFYVETISSSVTRVIARARWTIGGTTKTSTLYTEFTNWRF